MAKKNNEISVEALGEKERREAAAKEAKQREQEERAAYERRLKSDFVRVANSAAGRNVLRYFMRQCGHNMPSVTVDPQTTKILTDNTVYNEARRNIWLDARKKLPPHLLVKVEFNLEAAKSAIDYADD